MLPLQSSKKLNDRFKWTLCTREKKCSDTKPYWPVFPNEPWAFIYKIVLFTSMWLILIKVGLKSTKYCIWVLSQVLANCSVKHRRRHCWLDNGQERENENASFSRSLTLDSHIIPVKLISLLWFINHNIFLEYVA